MFLIQVRLPRSLRLWHRLISTIPASRQDIGLVTKGLLRGGQKMGWARGKEKAVFTASNKNAKEANRRTNMVLILILET